MNTSVHTGMLRSRLNQPNQFTAHKWTDADYVEYIKSRCSTNERGCWIHSGRQSLSKGMKPGSPGYIQVGFRGARKAVHRLMYTLHVGPIPDGMVVAHRCDNPPCCNPAHLFACTESENIYDAVRKKRQRQAWKTHCPRGHAYDFYWAPGNRRRCTRCDLIRQRIAAGWPEHLALTLPATPHGQRPVNATGYRRKAA